MPPIQGLAGYVVPVGIPRNARVDAHNGTKQERVRKMSMKRSIALAAVVIGLLASPALAVEEHHEPGATPPTGEASGASPGGLPGAEATPGLGGSGPGGMGMMGPAMMEMMGPCMQMMGSGMMGSGMMGQAGTATEPGSAMAGATGPAAMGMFSADPTKHLEGRIAFLRVELGITDEQAAAWQTFADALRANADNMRTTRGQAAEATPQASLGERLAQEQMWLDARLQSVQELREAYDGLFATLSDEQRGVAEQLIPPHLGPMPMRLM